MLVLSLSQALWRATSWQSRVMYYVELDHVGASINGFPAAIWVCSGHRPVAAVGDDLGCPSSVRNCSMQALVSEPSPPPQALRAKAAKQGQSKDGVAGMGHVGSGMDGDRLMLALVDDGCVTVPSEHVTLEAQGCRGNNLVRVRQLQSQLPGYVIGILSPRPELTRICWSCRDPTLRAWPRPRRAHFPAPG